MKKISCIIATFAVVLFLSASTTFAANSTEAVYLNPGWNVFSTPNVLSNISFADEWNPVSGSGIYFYTLNNGSWESVPANTGSIRPLEWYLVKNTNPGAIYVNLEFKQGLAPSEMLFSKTVSTGWNLLGVTTESNPFGTIGSNASMSVDFTEISNGSSNLRNKINTSFRSTSGNATVANPQIGESYAVFLSATGTYGGSQNPYSLSRDSLSITADSSLSWSILHGMTNVKVWSFVFSNSGSTDINMLAVQILLNDATGLANLVLKNGNIFLTSVLASPTTHMGFWIGAWAFIIQAGSSQTLDIYADITNQTPIGNLTTSIMADSVYAQGLISSNVLLGPSVAPENTLQIVQPIGTLSVSSSPINKSLLLAGSTAQRITSFRVTASNDAITLKDIALTGANLDTLSNIRLQDSFGTILGTATNITATGAIFTNLHLSNSFTLLKDSSAIFYVVADINSNTNINGVVVNITTTGSDIIGGTTNAVVAITGSNVPGASHDIATNTFMVVQGLPVAKDIATDAMEFTVTAFGQSSVTLSGAIFNNTLSGYTGSTTLTVVRKSDNAIVGSTTGSTGIVSFTANNILGAGVSETYIIKIVGAVVASGPSTPNWSVSLTNLITTTSLDAANYFNTGGLPLTSVK